MTGFIRLLPYLPEGNGAFPSTSETIQNTPHTAFAPLILQPLENQKRQLKTQLIDKQRAPGRALGAGPRGFAHPATFPEEATGSKSH